MNILYISIFPIASSGQSDVYADVSHEFAAKGHRVYVVSPLERRERKNASVVRSGNETFLRVKTLNNQKVGAFEKMFALLTTPRLLYRGIRKHFKDVRFDLIMYNMPFLKLAGIVRRLKAEHGAATYLFLWDMWPQSLADFGKIRAGSRLYRYFDANILDLYRISDHIGCMSPAGVRFLLERYPSLDDAKAHVCPLAVMLRKYPDPPKAAARPCPGDAVFFVYGGNIGVIQGVDFIMEALSLFRNDRRVFFALYGSGTEYARLAAFVRESGAANIVIRPHLPKDEYIGVLKAADAGMIFLDRANTVPNIPSRTLDYLAASLPVLAVTDAATDYRQIVADGGFGVSCLSGDPEGFRRSVETLLCERRRREMGRKGRAFLEERWTSGRVYDIISRRVGF